MSKIVLLFILFNFQLHAEIKNNGILDDQFDFGTFSGRVSDKAESDSILKISSENKNIKFFRAGDLVKFKLQNNQKNDLCEGFVRSVEVDHFVIFVKDLHPCYFESEYFRRGTALIFTSEKLAERVKEAKDYRGNLVQKRKDYMEQLNSINQSIFSYEERKVQVAADFDREIAALESKKVKELDKLITKKNDEIRIQRELAFRLDSIDKEMGFYRSDTSEPQFDRWHLDHDLGLPVYKLPEKLKEKPKSTP